MFEQFLNPLLTGLSVALLTFILTKITVNSLKKELKNEIQVWLNSENGQKALYSIGILIGNGAKAGFGLNPKQGKFKLEDLIMQGIGSWIQSKMPQAQQPPQPEFPSPY